MLKHAIRFAIGILCITIGTMFCTACVKDCVYTEGLVALSIDEGGQLHVLRTRYAGPFAVDNAKTPNPVGGGKNTCEGQYGPVGKIQYRRCTNGTPPCTLQVQQPYNLQDLGVASTSTCPLESQKTTTRTWCRMSEKQSEPSFCTQDAHFPPDHDV